MSGGDSSTFEVAAACSSLGLQAYALVFRGIRVGPSNSELRAATLAACVEVQRSFAGPAAILEAPPVLAFQDILRKVGVNPRKDRNSVERLLTYAFKRGDLPAVNSLVDAYNLASIRSGCSLGAHDLDRIALPVKLDFFQGNESFVPLGGTGPTPVKPGEFGYKDGRGAVLCRLDVVQAEFSKVTAETRKVLLIVEATASHSDEKVRQAIDEAADWIVRSCGGSWEVAGAPGPLFTDG